MGGSVLSENMKHTPAPWEARGEKGNYEWNVVAPDDDDLSEPWHIAECHDGAKGCSAEANARFIVRAVNAHDDLVAALRCLLNATMYRDHPAESQMAIDAIAKATGDA
jgi:hypothetical protein